MLTKTFVEKVLYDEGGMETESSVGSTIIKFFSVKYPGVSGVISGFDQTGKAREVMFTIPKPPIPIDFSLGVSPIGILCDTRTIFFYVNSENELVTIVRTIKERIDNVSPDREEHEFDPALDGTETESLEKQRRGQEIYRHRLSAYWHGRCAVTGVTVKEVLRASHAKAWKDCATGAERLSPFNGLLLCANLDALFDKYLISFDEAGHILISDSIPEEQYELIGINSSCQLILEERHQPFMKWHRDRFNSIRNNK